MQTQKQPSSRRPKCRRPRVDLTPVDQNPSPETHSPPLKENPNATFVSLARQIGIAGPYSFVHMAAGRVTDCEARALWRGVEPAVRRGLRLLAVLRDINRLAKSLNGPGVPPESLVAEMVWPSCEVNIIPSSVARKQAMPSGDKPNGESVSP